MAPQMELGVSDAAGQHVASRRKAEMSEQFLLLDSGGGRKEGRTLSSSSHRSGHAWHGH